MSNMSFSPSVFEKENVQTDLSPLADNVMKYTQRFETGNIGKGRGRDLRPMSSFGVSREEEESFRRRSPCASPGMQTRSSNPSAGQGMAPTKRKLFIEKEYVQPSTLPQVMTQGINVGSCSTKNRKKVRGKNRCKEVAALEIGQKLKVKFYDNRTAGEHHATFSRHLGMIVRNRNLCLLAVLEWSKITSEKLNIMWTAVVDKFEADDMEDHREHVFEWMKEIWTRWREDLHLNYVKNKPILEALRNVPKGVNKKDWEWLVKDHFLIETYQARSRRNTQNRAKLRMPHHLGSKPIREVIYQKGGKDGNPPTMDTIFFETHKKNDTLVDLESIEKHAQIQEIVRSQPSMPNIEIVEKCFGPQTRSHVFGFGGGVKAKDMKGGTTSKSALLSELRSSRDKLHSTRDELRSTREENKALKDRLSTVEKDMAEIKKFLLAQQSTVQPSTSHVSEEE